MLISEWLKRSLNFCALPMRLKNHTPKYNMNGAKNAYSRNDYMSPDEREAAIQGVIDKEKLSPSQQNALRTRIGVLYDSKSGNNNKSYRDSREFFDSVVPTALHYAQNPVSSSRKRRNNRKGTRKNNRKNRRNSRRN
jgi:hypothetical protein